MYQTILKVIFPGVTLWATTANVVLLLVLFKFGHLLQPTHKMFRQFIAVQDILLCCTYCSLNLSVLYLDQDIPSSVCVCLSIICAATFRCQWLSISIMAIERYIYVVHPLRYPHLMTKCKTLTGIGICIAIPLIFTMVTEGLFNRKLDVIRLACTYHDTASKIAQVAIFCIPSFIITTTISIVLWKLTKRIQDQDRAMTTPKIRKSFKLIAFISGSFWMTYIPFLTTEWLSEVVSMKLGYVNETMLSIIKFSCLFVSVYGSSSINPALQFYLDNDLWIGLQKLFGRKKMFSYQREIRDAMAM